MKKIKNEEIFFKFSQNFKTAQPNNIGKEQFFNKQSYGVTPNKPDSYYLRLIDGKKWFDWQIQEYIELYLSEEWWGWEQIINDYKNDLWLLPKMFPWEKNIKNIISIYEKKNKTH